MTSTIIKLPEFVPGTTKYTANDYTLYYNDKNRVLLPPQIIGGAVKGNINNLRTETDDVLNPYKLTDEGEEWATTYWALYAFIDNQQRDNEGRPIQKYNPTPENKLKFVNKFHELFGTEKKSTFVDHIKKDMNAEIVKRCKLSCQPGEEEKGSCNVSKNAPKFEGEIKDVKHVEKIVQSLKDRPLNEALNYVFNWLSSLTLESGMAWLEKVWFVLQANLGL